MKKKAILLIPSVLLLAALLLLIMGDSSADICSAVVTSAQGEEVITCWEAEDGQYYLFLPSYAELSNVRFDLHTETPVTIGGNTLFEGMSCEDFSLNLPYDFVYYNFGRRQERRITFMRSDGIATMYIDTQSGTMDYIHDNKEYKESGTLTVLTKTGANDCSAIIDSINGRGNYTWNYSEKKPYSIRLSSEIDLLELGNSREWVLLANAADFSNIRNKMVYEFADAVGLIYAPDSMWVDLYLNGEYAGLYLLCERIDVQNNRVEIAEENGYLVSLERADRIEGDMIETENQQALRIRFPLQNSSEQLAQMNQKWQAFENALLAEDGIDPITGKRWEEQIDLDSWAKKYLIEEIFANHDAGYTSQYFYGEMGDADMIFAGPVWDYDLSMGNTNSWQLQEPKSFFANRAYPEVGVQTPWYSALYQNELFYNRVVDLYQSVFRSKLSVLLDKKITQYVNEIEAAAAMDDVRWKHGDTTIHEQAKYIRDYLQERIRFLDAIWIDNQKYVNVRAVQEWGGYYAYYVLFPGESLKTLPTFPDSNDEIFVGWYYSDTNDPFDITKPITEDIEIYGKWEPRLEKKLKQVLKLAPLGIIAIMGLGLLTADIWKSRRA